jgi:hypothetical protein
MIKKASVFALLFLLSLGLLSGEKLGDVSIEEGMPLPFDKGVTWEYGESGFIQVFIHDDQFVLVFLDAQKRVWIPNDIDLATLHTRSVKGNGIVHPFHLMPSVDGLYFSNPRHVFEPHLYDVEVFLRKQVKAFTTTNHRKSRSDKRPIKESFEAQVLDQRAVETSPVAPLEPRRPALK